VDLGEVAKFLEGHARIGGAEIIGVVGQIAGEEDASVHGYARMDDPDHVEHQIGAIGGQRVVETRRPRKVVDRRDILAQQLPRVRGCHPQTIDPDVLASDVAAYPYDIPLVGRDDRQFILLEEPGNRRITLVALLAGLYGKRQPGAVVETEADDCVGNSLAGPV
jgi:hypothetical protein